jgi:hypothetical protein
MSGAQKELFLAKRTMGYHQIPATFSEPKINTYPVHCLKRTALVLLRDPHRGTILCEVDDARFLAIVQARCNNLDCTTTVDAVSCPVISKRVSDVRQNQCECDPPVFKECL